MIIKAGSDIIKPEKLDFVTVTVNSYNFHTFSACGVLALKFSSSDSDLERLGSCPGLAQTLCNMPSVGMEANKINFKIIFFYLNESHMPKIRVSLEHLQKQPKSSSFVVALSLSEYYSLTSHFHGNQIFCSEQSAHVVFSFCGL